MIGMGSISDDKEIMIERDLKGRDIRDERVIEAMKNIPREIFVTDEYRKMAYFDGPLPIGYGQTISQPYIVAIMTQELEIRDGNKILEIGTGSGYQTAILCDITGKNGFVYSIERVKPLANRARRLVSGLGYMNFRIFTGDGTKGLEEYSPFDRIIVTAASPDIPRPLRDQLAENGRLVIPVGNIDIQELIVAKKINGKLVIKRICGCRFVPLKGKYGWNDS